MRFGLFPMAEYMNMITLSALARDALPRRLARARGRRSGRSGSCSSCSILIFVFIWLRATLPRLRYDQLMRFGWKVLLPVATLNALVTAALRGGLRDARSRSTALKGFGVTLQADLQEADHAAVPGVQAAGLPALPRPPPAAPARERAREVRRLLALRGRLPGRLHPRRRRREHRRQPRLRRRALRAHLRDQHEPLHLLRLLRARLPVRRDHARQRVRDLRVLARRPDLHEGHAARRADQAGAGRRPRASSTRRSPYYKTHS